MSGGIFVLWQLQTCNLDTSLATVRLELAKEEAALTKEHASHKMSPSVFIKTGLDLEDQQ
jgi:hypothetical protein